MVCKDLTAEIRSEVTKPLLGALVQVTQVTSALSLF